MSKTFVSKENPYTLRFSFVPPQFITRASMTSDIIDELTRSTPAFQGHFITGVRGTGKTVMMANIAKTMSKQPDWVVVDIENPEGNILESLSRGLYLNPTLRALFIKAKLDLSLLGMGLTIEKPDAIASNELDALDYMLKALQKQNTKILVTIDEVTYCKEIAAFSHALSSYARAGYEIYVIMTGLKENIKAIKNNKSLTFLYRAKEHVLEPLNITAIIADYEKIFSIPREDAEVMAWTTKGYSFAFQLLGYLYWEECCKAGTNRIDLETIMPSYDQYLSEFSYEKIWSELPTTEKKVMRAIAENQQSQSFEVKAIRNTLNMSPSMFSVYRERLIDRGLIDGSEYGKIKLTLPRFGEYVRVCSILDI